MPLSQEARDRLDVATASSLVGDEISDALDSAIEQRSASGGTIRDLVLYVGTSGKDSNPGTETAPFATIQAALNSVPKRIRHKVIIQVGEGTFAGAYVSGFSIEPVGLVSRAASLLIRGTWKNSTLTTGSATGTLTTTTTGSNSTFTTVTDSTQSWTTDDLKGKFIYFESVNLALPVLANTGTVVTVPFNSAITNGLAYRIVEPVSVITTISGPQVTATASTTSQTTSVFTVVGCTGASVQSIEFEALKATISSADFVNNISNAGIGLRSCQVAGSSAGFRMIQAQFAPSFVRYCHFTLSGGQHLITAGALGKGGRQAVWNCRIVDSNSSNVFNSYAPIDWYIFACQFETPHTVMNAGHGAMVYFVNNRVLTAGNTVLKAARQPFLGSEKTVPMHQAHFEVTGNYIENSATVFRATCGVTMSSGGSNVGTGNTTVWKVEDGGRVNIASTDTVTGTTEINVDGSTSTLAALRGANPKNVSNTTTFSRIWES